MVALPIKPWGRGCKEFLTPVRSSFTSEPSHQIVNGRSIQSSKKKEGRRVRYNLQTN